MYEPTQQTIIFYIKPGELIYFSSPELAHKVGVGETQVKRGVHNLLSLDSEDSQQISLFLQFKHK